MLVFSLLFSASFFFQTCPFRLLPPAAKHWFFACFGNIYHKHGVGFHQCLLFLPESHPTRRSLEFRLFPLRERYLCFVIDSSHEKFLHIQCRLVQQISYRLLRSFSVRVEFCNPHVQLHTPPSNSVLFFYSWPLPPHHELNSRLALKQDTRDKVRSAFHRLPLSESVRFISTHSWPCKSQETLLYCSGVHHEKKWCLCNGYRNQGVNVPEAFTSSNQRHMYLGKERFLQARGKV